MRKSIKSLIPFLLLLTIAAAAEEDAGKPGDWPAEWKFRVVSEAAEAADEYDISFEHGGLGQPDGRDIRVAGPHGEPLSFIVSAADSSHYRVITDGAAGPGKYTIYFGNPSPKLPPAPAGISELGRKDWSPKGGFTCVSYDPLGPVDGTKLGRLDTLLAYYDTVIDRAQSADKEADAANTDPAKRVKHVVNGVYCEAARPLIPPFPFFHIFRAEIEIPAGGKYDFVIANAQKSDRFGVLFADGERKTATVQGLCKMAWGAPECLTLKGPAEFKAGAHILEFYTDRQNPEIRLGLAGGTSQVPDYLGGAYARYPAAKKLTPGGIEAAQDHFVENGREIVDAWIQQQRFTNARAACQFLQSKFHSDSKQLALLDSEFERLNQQTFDSNWMMEGKYPSRSNAVPSASLYPPLAGNAVTLDNRLDDKTHTSGCVFNEGKLIYGMPFSVQDSPWGLTSATCTDGNLLFVGTKNGVMHAVDLARGSERWSFTTEGECIGAPLLYQGTLYYGTIDRRMYALDVARGRMLWNFPAKGWIEGGPCAADGRIFFGSLDKSLYALDAKLGIPRWETPLDGPVSAPPSTDGKLVFVGTKTGKFYAVQADSGKIAWSLSASGAITGGACVGSGRVSFGDASGKLCCLDAVTGQPAWKQPCAVGGPIGSAPILVGSMLYGGTSDGKLYGIELESGEQGWRDTLPDLGDVCRPPIFADGKLVFSSRLRILYKELGGRIPVQNTFIPGQPSLVVYELGLRMAAVTQAAGDIAVDGKLDEASWRPALSLEFLRSNGFPSSYVNEARFLWDAKSVYIGVTCRDNPAADNGSPDDDNLTVEVDPKGDGVAVFQFTLSRTGIKAAALLTGVGRDPADPKLKQSLEQYKLTQAGTNWAPEWSAQVSPLSGADTANAANGGAGWAAEIAIPFESLPKSVTGPAQNGVVWRVNILRGAGKSGSPARPAMFLAPPKNGEGIGTPAQWQALQFHAEKVKL